MELLVILVVVLLILPFIYYLAALQRAFGRCAPQSRMMKPSYVWLMLIPGFWFIWHFVIVIHLAKSLRNEFTRLSIHCPDPAPARNLGLATSILAVLGIAPLLPLVAFIPGLVCWILYWGKVSEYAKMLPDPNHLTSAVSG